MAVVWQRHTGNINIKCVQTTGKQAVQWKETWYETYTNINTNRQKDVTEEKTPPHWNNQEWTGHMFYGRTDKLTSLQFLEFLIMFKQSNKWAESIVSHYGQFLYTTNA